MYGSWDIEQDRQNFMSKFFVLPYPPKNPKNQNFEKMKKPPRDIIILHQCTKNHDYMLKFCLDMACIACNYFSFWAIFLLFYLPNSLKNQN